jgi:hypothetical protein
MNVFTRGLMAAAVVLAATLVGVTVAGNTPPPAVGYAECQGMSAAGRPVYFKGAGIVDFTYDGYRNYYKVRDIHGAVGYIKMEDGVCLYVPGNPPAPSPAAEAPKLSELI